MPYLTRLAILHPFKIPTALVIIFMVTALPVAAGAPAKMVGISAGNAFYCALSENGRVYCWGDRPGAKPGDWALSPKRKPVEITGFSEKVATLSAGQHHVCAVTQSGRAMCWGNNQRGQLGNGKLGKSFRPQPVQDLDTGVQGIAAGENHTCALMDSGAVKCWGSNMSGQLGNGTKKSSLTPRDVSGLPGPVTALEAGVNHTCAITMEGALYCWGKNTYGQLGNGNRKDSLTPCLVKGLDKDVKQVSPSDTHTCAVIGEVGWGKCWGLGELGKLGNALKVSQIEPVYVKYSKEVDGKRVYKPLGGMEKISTSYDRTYAVMHDGQLAYWGAVSTFVGGFHYKVSWYQTPHYFEPPIAGLIQIATEGAIAGNSACGITREGLVMCWGSSENGKLGGKEKIYRTVPARVEW